MKIVIPLLLIFSFTLAFADCQEMGQKYRNELTLPYRDFTDLNLRHCLGRMTPGKDNLQAFIALAFYDNSLRMRQEALDKLEAYDCKQEQTCDELHGLLEGHIKATALVQSSTVTYRAEHLRDKVAKHKVRAPVNLCQGVATQAAQALARLNKQSEKVVRSSVVSDGTLYTVEMEQESYEVLTSGDSRCHIGRISQHKAP